MKVVSLLSFVLIASRALAATCSGSLDDSPFASNRNDFAQMLVPLNMGVNHWLHPVHDSTAELSLSSHLSQTDESLGDKSAFDEINQAGMLTDFLCSFADPANRNGVNATEGEIETNPDYGFFNYIARSDAVRVTIPVPEPGVSVLIALGGWLMWRSRRTARSD